ncbi:MAG: serine hydrolase [Candidatus Nealsonbacteria bacterium DGGOD1a]|jgi:D-alanyl-D-alanine carboxypeptidase|nr:MAG: serine hydrolase [Candidatus Nealsonbacteria bacterium DGGOD1a]
MAFFGYCPGTIQAFDWPAGAALIQRIQVLKQEIYNAKMLIVSAKSKKPNTAQAYLAMDLTNGAALMVKNPDKAYPIASTAKLMTAVIASENIDSEKTIALTKDMLSPEGSSPAIFAGLNISAKNLLQASLIQSTNDAAESLSYFIGREKFLALMNQKAKEIGMARTFFADVHGLDKQNLSTARDMAKLLTYIRKNNPKILEATKNNNFWLPDAQGKLLRFMNLNNFYGLPEFAGGKSGYSPEARQTFAGIFNINNKPIAIVLLRSTDFQSDTFKIIERLKN